MSPNLKSDSAVSAGHMVTYTPRPICLPIFKPTSLLELSDKSVSEAKHIFKYHVVIFQKLINIFDLIYYYNLDCFFRVCTFFLYFDRPILGFSIIFTLTYKYANFQVSGTFRNVISEANASVIV